MPSAESEIKENFNSFKIKWKTELDNVHRLLGSSETLFLNSYIRLASINAWRELLIKNEVSDEAYRFFCEAQNDGVSSHVLAGLGSWRASLKCLRSCIENVLLCEYYKDHPIELRLWLMGKHRLGFSDTINYFQKHPDIEGATNYLTGLGRLQKEYSILSRAVHGSDFNFRMTAAGGTTNLWSSDNRKLNSWSTRAETLIGINLILLTLHSKALRGASLLGLRQSIGLAINSSTLKSKIKENLGVNLNIVS